MTKKGMPIPILRGVKNAKRLGNCLGGIGIVQLLLPRTFREFVVVVSFLSPVLMRCGVRHAALGQKRAQPKGISASNQVLKFFSSLFLTQPFKTEKDADLVEALQRSHAQPGRKGEKIALASIKVLWLVGR